MRQTYTAKTLKLSLGALLFLVLLLGINGLGSSAWASSAQKLYEQGLLKESGERDPESALVLFRQAAQEAGPRNPGLVADARLHMGQCLEKLGKTDEALGLYLVITQNSEYVSAETLQVAQANGVRIQADIKRAADQAALEEAAHRNESIIMVPEYRTNALSFLIGPTLLHGSGKYFVRGDLALRLRIFGDRPRPMYLEIGAITPGSVQPVAYGTYDSPFQTTDQADLHLGYQIHFAFVRDLPHGKQNSVVPEIGVGAAYTTSRTTVRTTYWDLTAQDYVTISHDVRQGVWSPYLRAGVRFFANHPLSVLLGASYTAVPFKGSAETAPGAGLNGSGYPTPSHTASFDFPEKLWTVGAQLQVRFGRTEFVARPKP